MGCFLGGGGARANKPPPPGFFEKIHIFGTLGISVVKQE
jgi:hypothetical protein